MPITRRSISLFIYKLQGGHVWKLHPDHERIYLKKYDNGDDIKIILNELKIPTLKPDALDSTADDVYKHIFKEDIKAV